jgi:hypothetical protein
MILLHEVSFAMQAQINPAHGLFSLSRQARRQLLQGPCHDGQADQACVKPFFPVFFFFFFFLVTFYLFDCHKASHSPLSLSLLALSVKVYVVWATDPGLYYGPTVEILCR